MGMTGKEEVWGTRMCSPVESPSIRWLLLPRFRPPPCPSWYLCPCSPSCLLVTPSSCAHPGLLPLDPHPGSRRQSFPAAPHPRHRLHRGGHLSVAARPRAADEALPAGEEPRGAEGWALEEEPGYPVPSAAGPSSETPLPGSPPLTLQRDRAPLLSPAEPSLPSPQNSASWAGS